MSTGHGIDWGTDDAPPINPKYRQPNMHRLIFDHLDTKYPSSSASVTEALAQASQRKADHTEWTAPASDYAAWEGAIDQDANSLPHAINRAYGFSGRSQGVNSLINGASAGTGSDYFGYCFAEHIPEDVDIIVIELGESGERQELMTGINDQAITWTFEHYERMLRALLDLPNQPAIIYAEYASLYRGGGTRLWTEPLHWHSTPCTSAQTSYVSSLNRTDAQHKGLNQYYDIPSISLRNPFLPDALANTSFVEQMFGGRVEKAGTLEGLDLRHVGAQKSGADGRSRSMDTPRWQSWSLPTSTRSTVVCGPPNLTRPPIL